MFVPLQMTAVNMESQPLSYQTTERSDVEALPVENQVQNGLEPAYELLQFEHLHFRVS